MKAFDEFQREDKSFWFFIRFVSEKLGYTNRKTRQVKKYTKEEIEKLCLEENIKVDPETVHNVVKYLEKRADILNNFVELKLMNVDEAREIYEIIKSEKSHKCKEILNKQKGNKKQPAYFTNIITMLAEEELGNEQSFDPDPRGLIYMLNNGKIIGASSRRFDGAYKSIYSPEIVWEIKEYYYTTSFGSRIADAVYETQLDGYEFNEIRNRSGEKVYHVVFIDGHDTFWKQGKSYLCRFIDALNMGLIDELIIGKEVLSRWKPLLREILGI